MTSCRNPAYGELLDYFQSNALPLLNQWFDEATRVDANVVPRTVYVQAK